VRREGGGGAEGRGRRKGGNIVIYSKKDCNHFFGQILAKLAGNSSNGQTELYFLMYF
jgi:hypothetical protein